ncbi:MAG: PAS domain S-box protein [Bacteroidales bacterium]|nr:PAS domain S-box protein [Bacteroidales bacterium]
MKKQIFQLARDKEYLQMLSDNFPGGVLFRFKPSFDEAIGTFVYVGKSWKKMTNVSSEEAAANGRAVISKIHPEDILNYVGAIKTCLSSKSNILCEIRYLYSRHVTKWFQVSMTASLDRDDLSSVLLNGFLIDITDKKEAELALLDQQKRIRSLGDNLPGGILFRLETDIATEEKTITYASKQWEDIMGYSIEESHNFDLVISKIHPDDRTSFTESINRCILKRSMFNRETRYCPSIAVTIWLQVCFHPRIENDTCIGDGYIIDITGRKQTELELNNYRLHLENLVKERTEKLEAALWELSSANNELLAANEELNAINEKIQVKNVQLNDEIDTRNKILEQLRDSEEKFRSFIQQSMDGIFITDKNGIILHWNESQTRITGVPSEQAIGKHYWDMLFIYLPQQKRTEAYYEKLKQRSLSYFKGDKGQLPIMNELPLYMSDGPVRYVQSSMFPVGFAENRLFGCIVRDITERKKTEMELERYRNHLEAMVEEKNHELVRSESMYRQLTVASPDAVIMCSTGFVTKYMSPKAMELFGVEPDSGISAIDIRQFVHPHKDSEDLLEQLVGEQLSYVPQIVMTRNNGSTFFGEISAAAVKEHDGTKAGILMVIRDITKRKQAEMELVRAKEKAEESDKLKSSFLANMSHEIRTPINGINGFLNFLQDEYLTPKRRQYYSDIIKESSTQLVQLIDDIVDIAKIESKQLMLNPVPFNLNHFMQELNKSYEFYLRSKNREKLVVVLDDRFLIENCVIYIDSKRLRQVLTNLIGNAVKFTDKGYVRFGYRLNESGRLEFYVEDTGCGIPNDQLDVIFESFRQADMNNNRRYGGTGLGLTISRSIVRMLGGDISVQSELNIGSTFLFTISHIPVSEKEAQALEEKTDFRQKNRKIILVAESDNVKRMFYARLLAGMGATVLEAGDLPQWTEHIDGQGHIDSILAGYGFRQNPEVLQQVIRRKLPLILIVTDREQADTMDDRQIARITEPVTVEKLNLLLGEPAIPTAG